MPPRFNPFKEENLPEYGVVGGHAKAGAYSNRTYLNLEPNISVREGFDSGSYYHFRPNEQPPTKPKEIMRACWVAYDNIGIIKNVIDLMGDFGSQGISLVHTDKRTQNFYRKWWKMVNGDERSERFLNTFYRLGNVVIHRQLGTLTKSMKSNMSSAKNYKNVPSGYKFINPLSVDVKNGLVGLFLDKLEYEINLSEALSNALKEADFTQKPIRSKENKKSIPLNMDETVMFHYKKDDWQIWAHPMIYAILDDIRMFEKMKLGDMAAMDGAVSNVRLWTLGSLEYKIGPNKAAMQKLRNVLASNVGGGTIDLVWGPELSFKETESKVYNYLGDDKYKTVLNSIYGGLGIPQTLTGSAGQSGGFTNNFISLKTLIDRLEYGRDMLRKFWEKELELVAKAMGFTKPAQLHFDYMILANEAAEKNLLLQMADRNIISYETVRERLNEIDSVENSRVKREEKYRKDEKMPPKADPYHKVPEPMKDEGRPLTSVDTTKRKQKEVKPKTSPTMTKNIAHAETKYKKIASIVQKPFLSQLGRKNLREMTTAEFAAFEDFKFLLLCNLQQEVSEDSVFELLERGNLNHTSALDLYNESRADFIADVGRNPDIDEERLLRIVSYVTSNE